MKRILYVVNHAGFFVSHRLAIAQAARASGYEVHVAAAPDSREAEIVAAGLHFHPWEVMRASRGVVQEGRALRSLDKIVCEIRPDIMHLVTMKGMLYGGAVARARSVPSVLFAVSGLGYVFLREGARASLFRGALLVAFRAVMRRDAAHAVFQNEDDMQVFQDAGCLQSARSYTMIRGSGVDLRLFPATPLPGGTPSFVLPARMLRDKGVEEFVAAARILRLRGHKARFLLAGGTDANPASISESTLLQWQSEGLVEWLGHRKDMASVLADAFAVVLPSYREGLPKALLEGAASGRPLVATDVPGCRDVVRDGETGWLVPARDANALADAMERLLLAPQQARTMGAAARRDAEERFALPAVVIAHLNLYESLV